MSQRMGGRAVEKAIFAALALFGGDPAFLAQLHTLQERHAEKWCQDQEAAGTHEFYQQDPPWGLPEEELFNLLSEEQAAELRKALS